MTYPNTPNRKVHGQGTSASAGAGQPQSDSPSNRKAYGYSSGSVGQALANAFPRRRGATPAAGTPAAMAAASAPVGTASAATAPAVRSVVSPQQVESDSDEPVDPFKRTSFKLAPDEYAEIANHRPTPEPLERIFDTTTIGRIFRFHHPDGGGTETGPFWRNWMWVPVAFLIGSAFIVGGYLALKTRTHSTTQSTMAARTAPELPVESESGVEPQSPVVVKQVNVPSSEREGAIEVKPVTGSAEAKPVPSSNVQGNIDGKATSSSGVHSNVDAKAVPSSNVQGSIDGKTAASATRAPESTKPFVDPTRVTPKVTLSRENGNAPKAQRTPKASREATPKSVPAKKAEDEAPRTPFVKTPFTPAD